MTYECCIFCKTCRLIFKQHINTWFESFMYVYRDDIRIFIIIYIHIYEYIYIYKYMQICIYIYIYMYVYLHTFTCTNTWFESFIFYIYTHLPVHKYTHTRKYIVIYSNIRSKGHRRKQHLHRVVPPRGVLHTQEEQEGGKSSLAPVFSPPFPSVNMLSICVYKAKAGAKVIIMGTLFIWIQFHKSVNLCVYIGRAGGVVIIMGICVFFSFPCVSMRSLCG